ncbi:MAG: methionine synthase [Bacteroidales bacterium]|nr:methionine synthase [Bacteroidales bacterium]
MNDQIYNKLINLLQKEILVLDGAMGTMIQTYNLTEDQYRGERFKTEAIDQKGNNELLNFTQSDIIKEIHQAYLTAGADIIETNTFNANAISMSDYGLETHVYDLNKKAAEIAREAIHSFQPTTQQKFVAGVIGPTNKSASISPSVEDPGYRDVTFNELFETYYEQAKGLWDGGVDIFLIETIFDTLNAKAAIQAIKTLMNSTGHKFPIMVSFTINDTKGRMLTGQSIEAFLSTISDLPLPILGMNCAFGAKHLEIQLKKLADKSHFFLSAHPNAGLPNELGEYEQSPYSMAKEVESYCKNGLVNIIGGCCGSKPEHIREISKTAKKYSPRKKPQKVIKTILSGLDELNVSDSLSYIKIGERTNVMGSKKFLRLIKEEKYEEALEIAKEQIENGAQMLNINMDEAMIDGKKAMVRFLRLLASDPKINSCPLMLDSSNFSILHEGLKNVTGKPIINSISLKEGENEFLQHAAILKDYGAAVVVMAFDENGQADTFGRKKQICLRSYKLLTEAINFPPENIIFDPNVLTVATGIEEHNNYAVDFIKATRWIKNNLPHAKVSGGISNVSFSFRGNTAVRDAMNSVFVHLTAKAGLDFAIINPSKITPYKEIPIELRNRVENVLLNKDNTATEKLLEAGKKYSTTTNKNSKPTSEWLKLNPEERIIKAVIHGETRYLTYDLDLLRDTFTNTLNIIEGPLMEGMAVVGNLFEKGEMFLPQVVKTARTMKQAVNYLMPYIEKENKVQNAKAKGKILLATVKGDVHDIGKNILALVLSCNNYEIIDLGVMVSNDTIINAIKKHQPDVVGVSGLITPSLNYMQELAEKMEANKFRVPLILGGATTSEIHTAVIIAPVYSGLVLRGGDASQSTHLINQLFSNNSTEFKKDIQKKQFWIKTEYDNKAGKSAHYKSLNEARKQPYQIDFKKHTPIKPHLLNQNKIIRYKLKQIEPHIDWQMFFYAWGLKGKFPRILEEQNKKGSEARRLFAEAKEMLADIIEHDKLEARAILGIYPAAGKSDDILLFTNENRQNIRTTLPMLRQQKNNNSNPYFFSLSDYIAPVNSGTKDYIGTFAASAGFGGEKYIEKFKQQGDSYNSIMFRLIADRLTEAMSELLHQDVRSKYWGYSKAEQSNNETLMKQNYSGIRPSPGYPACPDHSLKKEIFSLMDVEKNIGIKLTESYSMHPASSVCGFYFSLPQSRYFNLGKISKDQVQDYAKRQNISTEQVELLFRPILNYNTNK